MFTACKPVLIPAPNTDFSSERAATKTAPAKLTASHGLKRKISLSWEKNPEARYYRIYASHSPQGPFVQINETKGNSPKLDLIVPAGTDRYYYVNALFDDGSHSENSEIVRGTSLAIPLISSIEPLAETPDETLAVHWWMNNVDKNSYGNKVYYTITCYNENKVEATLGIDSPATEQTKAVFNNLKPNTNYSFTVEAYTADFQNDTEKSDKLDSETARRLRPNPPENTRISQGDKTNSIEISFTLPDFVDVAQGNKIFKSHPIYFKIYRKQKGTNDNFILIKDKLRPKPASSYAVPDKPTYDELYTAYKPGEILQWVDDGSENIDADNTKDVERGVQYTYKIQSFADGTNREISSDLSFVSADGWARAKPSFEVAGVNYKKHETLDRYIRTDINFNFDWESFGKAENYAFVLSERRYKLRIDNNNTDDTDGQFNALFKFTSPSALKDYMRSLSIPQDDEGAKNVRGYYTYTLYFVAPDFSLPENPGETHIPSESQCKEKINAVRRVLVTDDTSKPNITDFSFTVEDGYKDKINLKWKHKPGFEYKIAYYPENDSNNKTEITDFSSIVTDTTADNADLTYEHKAASGASFKYIFYAVRNIEVESEPVTGQTLGMPEPVFDDKTPEYDSIRLTWNEVQKADSYMLEFKTGDKSVIDGGSGTAVPSLQIKKMTDGSYTADTAAAEVQYDTNKKLITCTLKKPIGYNDAVKSGKPIKVKVKAKNGATTDETENETEVRTLGPALTAVEASDASYNDEIIVTWTPVVGAAGYIVKRTTQTSLNDSTPVHHQYLVKADDLSVTVDSEAVSPDIVRVESTADKIRLYDIAVPPPAENPALWQIYQEKISWGAKHTYAVFPIKDINDVLDPETNMLTNITYTDVDKVSESGSALGYGRVTASKAEDPRKIEITWTKPYLGIREGLVPVLWKKESGADAQWQKTDISLDAGGDKFVYVPKDGAGERFKAFEFIVSYKESETKPLAAYISRINQDKDEYNETLHKGYVFSIEFKAENQSSDGTLGFNELLRWKPYDKTERSRAPESDYKVFIKNTDYGADWQEIAVINKDTGAVSWTAEKADWAVKREQQGNAIIVKPDMTPDAHSGLLQVLRDYRHYAKIETTRTNTAGEVITASFADNDEKVYAYRQITDKELALMTTMALAHGIQTSMTNESWKMKQYCGINPVVTSDGLAYRWYFAYTNYKPFCLSVSGTLQAVTWAVHQYPAAYGAEWSGWTIIPSKYNTLTLTGPAELNGLYSGTITISALQKDGSGTLTVTRKDQTSINFKNITPLVFKEHSYYPAYNDWTVSGGWK